MVIRIRCDAKIAQCQLGMKFGCNPVTEAPNLLMLAKALGLNVVGVSFHVGSGCGEIEVFSRAIATARKIFDFAATLGFDFNLLDIGGGFPGDRGTTIDPVSCLFAKVYSFLYLIVILVNMPTIHLSQCLSVKSCCPFVVLLHFVKSYTL